MEQFEGKYNGAAMQIFRFDELDSTNNEAKRRVLSAARSEDVFGQVIIAKAQTKGRGRLSRKFDSPAGNSLYITFILKPYGDESKNALVTSAVAVAVCAAIKRTQPEAEPKIKWVNDIFAGRKKVCGILAEAVSKPGANEISALVVGIGVNINRKDEDFPKELQGLAGSIFLSAEGCKRFENALTEEVFAAAEKLEQAGYEVSLMARYRERSLIRNGDKITVRYLSEGIDSPMREATALEIANDGSLLVRRDDGQKEALRSGEVSILSRD